MTFRTWQISEDAARGYALHVFGKKSRFTVKLVRKDGVFGLYEVALIGKFSIDG